MKKGTITASLGRAIARYTTEPFNFPTLTIVVPAAETDYGLSPAQSVEICGDALEALAQMLIDAGYCSNVDRCGLLLESLSPSSQPRPH